MTIRQPIVTVAGHVDHGKTSLLDALRCSSVAECEAGAITQKISFTLFPQSALKKSCPLIETRKIALEIPGFLFIDTPGHAAFNNIRKRGGSLADLAILVIDLNEGIKPQTAEVIQILKSNKTPFIIALNKIDKIKGWQKISNDLKENIEKQPINAKQEFEEKFYTLVGSLNSYGFESDLFYKITDFTKKIAMVPCSAKTKEGLPELIMVLCGLSQKFLKENLKLGKKAKGVVLEIKKENAINCIESILYDGELKIGDKIAIASFNKLIFTKVKAIHEIMPMSDKFRQVEKVRSASGIRIYLTDKAEILPGMPFITYENEKEAENEFKEITGEAIKTDKQGIIIKADSLGSLEAMIVLLKQSNIQIVKAGIGSINKSDILAAKANLEINPIDAVILGFNVEKEEEISNTTNIKIITNDVVYKLIEDLQKYREEKNKEIEKERLMGLSNICKLEILHKYMFRNSNPAIFGINITTGKLKANTELIDENGEYIGRIKHIQSEKSSVEEASHGMEVAISIPGINFERKLGNKKYLYSALSDKQIKTLLNNKDILSGEEISVIRELQVIKEKAPQRAVKN
ncbi:MAG: translation initiation factor IF-2 [Candidatus Pacearchaeota archaeon]